LVHDIEAAERTFVTATAAVAGSGNVLRFAKVYEM